MFQVYLLVFTQAVVANLPKKVLIYFSTAGRKVFILSSTLIINNLAHVSIFTLYMSKRTDVAICSEEIIKLLRI